MAMTQARDLSTVLCHLFGLWQSRKGRVMQCAEVYRHECHLKCLENQTVGNSLAGSFLGLENHFIISAKFEIFKSELECFGSDGELITSRRIGEPK